MVNDKHVLGNLLYFILYWVILGFLSSFGFGTGLHTFILYLGPHIMKVIQEADRCGKIPQMLPDRWAFQTFEHCETTDPA